MRRKSLIDSKLKINFFYARHYLFMSHKKEWFKNNNKITFYIISWFIKVIWKVFSCFEEFFLFHSFATNKMFFLHAIEIYLFKFCIYLLVSVYSIKLSAVLSLLEDTSRVRFVEDLYLYSKSAFIFFQFVYKRCHWGNC